MYNRATPPSNYHEPPSMYMSNMATEGSYTGKLALATLAADLGVTAGVLKVILGEAFDIMQDNNIGTPGLFLHMALARRGYQIDGQVVYTKINLFRNIFGRSLSDAPGQYCVSLPPV